MADLTPLDRLQPCLLDRLTDEEPDKTKEGRNERVVSYRRYREHVLRDLDMLLNSHCPPAEAGLGEFPEAAGSVLNFGLPDLCGALASSLRPVDLERRIAEVVRRFEPRILPETLSVMVSIDTQAMGQSSVSFEIRGELWSQPVPDSLYVKTDVDLETGQFLVKDQGSG